MRRRLTGVVALLICFMLVAAGCGGVAGKKDAGSIVKGLDKKVEGLKSYSTSGTMVLNTGTEPQEYQVEVWYQKPNYYRIALSNAQKDISQIVLKNEEGVFVLTPHLNKSFRFQSDWPANQGQVYLFESLVKSVSQDGKRHFTKDGDSVVFDVVANYSNASLVRQKVWFNEETYAPQHVEIYDQSNNALVIMNFNNFEFDKAFDKDSFDMQRNMTSGKMTLPTLGGTTNKDSAGTAGGQGTEAGAGKSGEAGTSAGKTTGNTGKADVSVIEPSYLPAGVNKPSISETKAGGNPAVVLKYTGTYNYTLTETHPSDAPVSYQSGKLMDLGYGFGILTGTDKKTLVWMYEGTEFRLSSGDLPESEMVKIAAAVQDQSAK